MSRTRRMSRSFIKRGDRDGNGYCCPSGQSTCPYCRDSHTHNNRKRAAIAQSAITEWQKGLPA